MANDNDGACPSYNFADAGGKSSGIATSENTPSSDGQAWFVLLRSASVPHDAEKADLLLLVGTLAADLKLRFEANMCFASRRGCLTVSRALQRLGTLIACGSKGVLLYRQTIDGPRQLGDHFPTIVGALTALLLEVRW